MEKDARTGATRHAKGNVHVDAVIDFASVALLHGRGDRRTLEVDELPGDGVANLGIVVPKCEPGQLPYCARAVDDAFQVFQPLDVEPRVVRKAAAAYAVVEFSRTG